MNRLKVSKTLHDGVCSTQIIDFYNSEILSRGFELARSGWRCALLQWLHHVESGGGDKDNNTPRIIGTNPESKVNCSHLHCAVSVQSLGCGLTDWIQ